MRRRRHTPLPQDTVTRTMPAAGVQRYKVLATKGNKHVSNVRRNGTTLQRQDTFSEYIVAEVSGLRSTEKL